MVHGKPVVFTQLYRSKDMNANPHHISWRQHVEDMES